VKLSDLTDYANFKLHGRIALVLGRDLFGAAPMLLDLAALSPSRGGRSGQPLPLTSRFGLDMVPVTIEGVRGHAALSLRGLEPMMINAGFAARAAIGRNRGGDRGAGAVMASGTVIRRLEIAGRRFANVVAALDAGDRAPDAWIGPDILRHFRLELDLPARTIWFDPA
jgi:hypothetical protein